MMKLIQVNLNKKTVKSKGQQYKYWVARWTDLSGKAHTDHLGRADGSRRLSKRQAEVLRRRRELEINQNPFQVNTRKPEQLSTFIDNYLKARKNEIAEGTFELHKTTGKYLRAFFRDDPRIDHITKQQARSFKTALGAGELSYVSQRPQKLSAGTIDGHMRNARTMFNFAKADEMITDNPFSHLCQTIRVDKEWHYVTPSEYERLVNASPDVNWQLLFALCRLAALRRAEALHLTWNNIDWNNYTLEVISKDRWKTKTRRSRKVPICLELQAQLAAADPGDPSCRRPIIEGISKSIIRRMFHKIRKAGGVDEYNKPFQAMRKSCAQDWADQNVHPLTLQEWMGHTTFDTTMNYYLKVSNEEYKRASKTNFLQRNCTNTVQKAENSNT